MKPGFKVGIIGDFNTASPTHKATNEAIGHASAQLNVPIEGQWIPTLSLEAHIEQILQSFAALWGAPGSPYQGLTGALNAFAMPANKIALF
jgi:CTP synthase (UTP-ammonia lyase)